MSKILGQKFRQSSDKYFEEFSPLYTEAIEFYCNLNSAHSRILRA